MLKNYALIDEEGNIITTIISETPLNSNMIEITESNCFYNNISFYENEFFYTKQPYSSWTKLNGKWISPSPAPNGKEIDNGLSIIGEDGKTYIWKEDQLAWIDMQTQTLPAHII
jgi:hypothetical protein